MRVTGSRYSFMSRLNMVLVTGGAGYIGSHLVLTLLKQHHDVVVYDNLITSTLVNIAKIRSWNNTKSKLYFIKGDVRDPCTLETVFNKYEITAVIHLAGLKSVSDSCIMSDEYHDVNVVGSLTLFKKVFEHDISKLIFSSTAATYCELTQGIYSEESAVTGTSSPYGHSKLEAEKVLTLLKEQNILTDVVILRYFNPVGIDSSGLLIEENHNNSNLFPNILKKRRKNLCLQIYGNDYLTIDGTAVRDYIHIEDLISVHVMMLNDIAFDKDVRIYNVGTEKGYSVKQVVDTFNDQTTIPLWYEYDNRRWGDVGKCIADTSKLKREFNWSPQHSLASMVRSVLSQ